MRQDTCHFDPKSWRPYPHKVQRLPGPHRPDDMTSLQQLDTLSTLFAALRSGSLSPHEFSRQARELRTLLAALPPAFSEVLGQLLDRLESSALSRKKAARSASKA